MHSAFLGEFLGTMIMILLGNGVVANVVLRQTKGEKSGWIVITTGWCFAVMAGVFTSLAIGSDGHLNPAVTVGVAVSSGDWSRLSVYVPAQILGAMAGALLVWLAYLHHRKRRPSRRTSWPASPPYPPSARPWPTSSPSSSEPSYWCWWPPPFPRNRHRRGLESRPSGPSWSAFWCGESAYRWAAPPATPSIRRAISVRASCTRCCPFPGRVHPTSATPSFPSSVR